MAKRFIGFRLIKTYPYVSFPSPQSHHFSAFPLSFTGILALFNPKAAATIVFSIPFFEGLRCIPINEASTKILQGQMRDNHSMCVRAVVVSVPSYEL